MDSRTSTDSDDPEVTLLLNDTPFDNSSDFIDHVSTPIGDESYRGAFRSSNYRRVPVWWRVLVSFRSFFRRRRRLSQTISGASCLRCDPRGVSRRKGVRWCMQLGLGTLALLGIVQVLVLLSNFVSVFLPDDVRDVIEYWGQIGRTGEGLDRWPTDFTRDIQPIHCHSHNDYWRRVPLFSAVSAGCISVEADVWLFDEDLYVGHSTGSLTRNRALKALYIDPLMDILAKQNPVTEFRPASNISLNGVFDTDASQSLILLIDFKTAGSTTWPYVVEALGPLRTANYLSHWNGSHFVAGPVTVVGTGNAPFEHVLSNVSSHFHDIFFDAPLDKMWSIDKERKSSSSSVSDEAESRRPLSDDGEFAEDNHFQDTSETRTSSAYYSTTGSKNNIARDDKEALKTAITNETPPSPGAADAYNTQNSYYASASFGEVFGCMWRYRLSSRQMALLRGQIRGAHQRGLKVRYWDLPNWPIGLRNHVWDVLMREGVDMDDLRAASRWDWKRGKHPDRRDRYWANV